MRNLLVLGGLAALLAAAPARAQSGSKPYADFHLLLGMDAATYRDHSSNETKQRSEGSGKIPMSGQEFQIGGVFDGGYGLELSNRTLKPKDVDWWSQRSELTLTGSYYWAAFPWVQPSLGYTQIKQTGDRDAEEAPPSFIEKNTALVFGLQTSFTAWDFGGHGPMVQGRIGYLTSLESGKNFGTEGYAGLGYFFATGAFRAALVAGQVRNFFNAQLPDPDDSDNLLKVRHVYTANRFGLYVEY